MNAREAAQLAKSIKRFPFTVELCGEDDERWLVLTPMAVDPERPWLWHEVRKPSDWVRIAQSD